MPIDDKTYQLLLQTFSEELRESHQALVDLLLKFGKSNKEIDPSDIQALFRTAHNIKGAARSVSLDAIAAIAHQLEDIFSQWRGGECLPNKEDVARCMTLADRLLSLFSESTEKQSKQVEFLKIPLERIEKINTKSDELINHKLYFENMLLDLNGAYRSFERLKIAARQSDQDIVTGMDSDFLKIIENANQMLNNFDRSVYDLQSLLREMRLIPISHILTPLKRHVHELAASLQKKVTLEVVGDEIEVDKSILDLMTDPLKHLIRNAIDHGIETEDQRKKSNKNAQGCIRIIISQLGGKIQIALSDDGRGIDLEGIKKKLVAEKYVEKNEITQFTDQELLQFIMKPGFTTSNEVTEISGRGVGLDIVLSQIEKAKGSIKIDTHLGKGTTFIIDLPLTLTTTRCLVVRVGDQSFMIPSLALNSLYAISSTDLKTVDAELVFVANDNPVPVRFLGSLLRITSEIDLDKQYHGILFGDKKDSMIVLVDQIDNEHDCVIRPLPAPLNALKLYIGVSQTGANELVPVLNPRILFRLAMQHATVEPLLKKNTEKEMTRKNILIVDDSLTTRSLSANALRAAGYQVTLSSDGRQAWNVLQKNTFDCVVSDIEMPHMNGYELTKLIKAHATLKSSPVIIVSSHDSDDEKAMCVSCGADAYLSKSQFNSKSLIDLIESLL